MGTASEVTTRDVSPSIRALPTFPVDVLAVTGVTLWGEINTPTVVVDFDDFSEKYQGYMLNYETPVQIRQFFLGGGTKAIVNRVVHIASNGAPVTAAKSSSTAQTAGDTAASGTVLGTNAAPFALVNGDTLVADVDGVGNQTATIVATKAELECANSETFALSDGQTLEVKIDGEATAQVVTFNTADFAAIGTATAAEVAAVINQDLVGASASVTGTNQVTIYSDTFGTSSSVKVDGGTANTALGFSTTLAGTVGNNVANSTSVTIAELKVILEAAWTNGSGVTVSDVGGFVQVVSNTTGASSSIQVDAASTADDELGLDNVLHTGSAAVAENTLRIDGKYEGSTIGDALTYDITAATDGIAEHFDLVVYLNGTKDKTHANLTMDTASADYAPARLSHDKNESMLVDVVDLSASGTVLERRPVNVSAASLSGGNDGLADLDDNDFIGYEASSTGIYAFDQIDEGDIFICPDRATNAVHNALALWLEGNKKRTACGIPDPTLGLDSDGAITLAGGISPSEQLSAMPWPAVKIPNPDVSVYGRDTLITIKPSGSIAGRYALNTRSYETNLATQPANEVYGRLANVVNVETDEIKRIGIRRKVTPLNINPIFAGKDTQGRYGVWLNDVQAGNRNGNFKSIGETRMMANIRKVILAYLETIRTTPNTPENRLKDKVIIEAYLVQWLSRGALASTSASEAFYVNTDPAGLGINNPLVQEREEYKLLVAVATARSRRFVEALFTRDQRAVEVALQQQLVSP